MFCKNCGKELPDDSRFCQACGTSQDENSNSSIANETESSEDQQRGIGKFFVKKFFIGSIVSFIVGTIGIIAVFFPSLFNLEKAKILEYTLNISSDKDAAIFYNFLNNNQNLIVNLDLNYLETYDMLIDVFDDNGYLIRTEHLDYEGHAYSGKHGYSSYGNNNFLHVVSDFNAGGYERTRKRENGLFSFYIEDQKMLYIVNIPYNSNYLWGIDTESAFFNKNKDEYYNGHIVPMNLHGTFLIKKPIDINLYNNTISAPTFATTVDTNDEIFDPDGNPSIPVSVFELEPIRDSSMVLKNY